MWCAATSSTVDSMAAATFSSSSFSTSFFPPLSFLVLLSSLVAATTEAAEPGRKVEKEGKKKKKKLQQQLWNRRWLQRPQKLLEPKQRQQLLLWLSSRFLFLLFQRLQLVTKSKKRKPFIRLFILLPLLLPLSPWKRRVFLCVADLLSRHLAAAVVITGWNNCAHFFLLHTHVFSAKKYRTGILFCKLEKCYQEGKIVKAKISHLLLLLLRLQLKCINRRFW